MALDKKQLRKEQYRLEILQAAEQVFARQGFHKTTMEEVADECGWSKGTLYLYFKSKEDLFFSVIIHKMDKFASTLKDAMGAVQNLEQLIGALVNAQFQFFIENNEFFQLAISEQGKVMQDSDSGMREGLIEKQQQHVIMASHALKKHLPENSPIKPDTLARSILGAINIHTLTWLLQPDTINPEELKQEIIQLFLHGVNPHV